MNVTNSIHNRSLCKVPPDTTSKRPWGLYLADNYTIIDATSGYIPDSGSNSRPAATTTNVTKITNLDQNFKRPVLAGGITTKIKFPSGSLPTIYTILSVTRYTGPNRNRILVSPDANFTHSHYETGNGKFYNNTSVSNLQLATNNNFRPLDAWCISISTNSIDVPLANACGINNNYFGINKAAPTPANYALGINNSRFGSSGQPSPNADTDMSDFQFYALVIYDQGLTVAEMTTLSTKYMDLLVDQAV